MTGDRVRSEHNLFPRIPYDEVTSQFVQDEIRRGRFYDLDHRSYVNDLVYVEWFSTGERPPHMGGISRASMHAFHWRIAAKYPKAYDTVRSELGKRTRADLTWDGQVTEDEDARRRWAAQHRAEWVHVARHTDTEFEPPDGWQPVDERPLFSSYRFPVYPYDGVRAPFIIAEISRGSFADLEFRRYVNRLIYIEAFTRDPALVEGTGYPPVRPWRIAAAHPLAFDAVRHGLNAPIRAELVTIASSRSVEELPGLERRHAAEWERVRGVSA